MKIRNSFRNNGLPENTLFEARQVLGYCSNGAQNIELENNSMCINNFMNNLKKKIFLE